MADKERSKRNLPKTSKTVDSEEHGEPAPMDQLALVLSRMMEMQAKWDEENDRRQEERDRRQEEEGRRRLDEEIRRRETEERREEMAEQRRQEELERRMEWERKMTDAFLASKKEPEFKLPKVKLHKFNEDHDDIEAFLDNFEENARNEKWPQEFWSGQLRNVLTGAAQRAVSEMNGEDRADYDKTKEIVLEAYKIGPTEYRRRYFEGSLDMKSPRKWCRWFCTQFDRWVKSSGMDVYELMKMEGITRHCPYWLKDKLRDLGHKSLEDTIDTICRLVDNGDRKYRQMDRNRRQDEEGRLPWTPPVSQDVDPTERKDSQPREHDRPYQKRQAPKGAEWDKNGQPKCVRCGEWGHVKAVCPNPVGYTSAGQLRRNDFLMDGAINGKQSMRMLLDSGASRTIVQSKFLAKNDYLGRSLCFETASNKQAVLPLANAQILAGGEEFQLVVGVSDSIGEDALLGTDIPNFKQWLVAKMLQDDDTALAITRAQQKKLDKEEEEARMREMEDEVLPTPLEEDCPEPEELHDADFVEEGERSLSNPHTEEVEESEACLGEIYNLDPSLFLQVGHKERLTRSEKRKQRQSHVTRMEEAADQNRPESISRDQLIKLQREDPTLALVRRQADQTINGYTWKNDVLVKLKDLDDPESDFVFVLPQLCRLEVLKMAHSSPTAGHFGRKRTLERLRQRFHWPGIREAVTQVCNSCPVCQKASPPTHHQAPLQPLPVMDVPFRRVAMDIFGPLKRTKQGNRYILVLMDYATKWPEAYPMKAVDSESVARTLIDIFARLGVPDELLTDNGSNFTSRLMKRFYDLTGIHHLKTSAYHPATDGMVERFNQTLKQTLRKLTQKSSDDWDACIPYLMWAYRGTVHASTGYSPFELMYGRRMRDGLDVLADIWNEEKDTDPIAVIEYLRKLRERMQQAREIVNDTETKAKASHKKFYDRKTVTREFNEGDMVLVLLPKLQYKLVCEWQGPYEVVEKKSPVTYVIDVSDSRKRLRTFHINALKEWVSPVPAVLSVAESEEVEPLTWQDESTEEPAKSNLTPEQEQDLGKLLHEFEAVISDVPGKTDLLAMEHRIETGDEPPVRLRIYQTPHGKDNGNADGLSRIPSETDVALEEGEVSGIHPLNL